MTESTDSNAISATTNPLPSINGTSPVMMTTLWNNATTTLSPVGTSDQIETTASEPQCGGLNFLGECVSTVPEYFSFITGTVTVLLWLCANQQYLQAKRKQGNAATGLVIYVIHLLLADSMNLLGAILCDQLGTQILTAIFLVVCDVIFVFLLMCTWQRQKAAVQLNNNWNAKNAAKTQNGSVLPVCCLLIPWALTFAAQPITTLHTSQNVFSGGGSVAAGRKLLMVTDSPVDNFGFSLGIIAALLYATVRLTTIKDSIYRKDLIRQEMSFHVLAALSCILYCISVVLYSMDGAYIINALPWLCGQAILGIEDLFIVFMTWRFAPSKIRASRIDDDAMLLDAGGDRASINTETDYRPSSAPQGASVVNERRSPFLKTKPYLEVVEKVRSDTMNTDVSFLGDDIEGGHMTDPSNQRVQIQVISEPAYRTAGPEEDLFMNRRNLRPTRAADYDDEFEWDFSDIDRQYDASGNRDGKWGQQTQDNEWDEEKILKEIEDELNKAGSDDERASTPSLSYNGHPGSHEDLTQGGVMEGESLT